MPTTTFAGRRPAYIEQYARTVAAVNRYQDIQRTIADEQAAAQYLDGLIAQERQVLTDLQGVFRTPPETSGGTSAIIQQQYALEDARRQSEAARRAARAGASRVDPATVQRILEPLRRNDKPTAIATAREALRGSTTVQAEKILNQLAAVADTYNLAAADLQELRTFAQQNARAMPSGAAPAGEFREQEQAFAQALESAYFAGPSGIRGGYEGLEVANLRGLTAEALRERAATEDDQAQAKRLEQRAAALEASAFATADDALEAAFAVVRATGDPSAIEDEYARTIYEEARQRQAYRNDQRADFEQEVLDSRKRLARLEQQRAEAPGSQYTDPRQEAIRRELAARGYDLERNGGRYLRYQKSPYYDLMIDADSKLRSVLEDDVALEPVNRAQRMAETLVLQYDRTGTEYDIEKLRRQLSKALAGDELQDALAYALAYKEADRLGLSEPTQRELQRQKTADEQAQRERQRQESERRAREAELARRDVEALETEQAVSIRERRAAVDPAVARTARDTYTRLRAQGLSPEMARRRALQELQTQEIRRPGEAPRILMGTEFAEEVARRPGTAPEIEFAPSMPEVELAPSAASVTTRKQDPTNRAYEYEEVDDGFRVYFQGRPVSTARKGTRAAQSIESVLAGGAPLPRAAPPAPAAPAAPAAPPAPDVDLGSLSDDELQRRIAALRAGR